MQVRWQVENDPYCIRVLEKHWPSVKRYGDIRDVKWSEVEPVDLICGGFPCQPVSCAGLKKGSKDERWLWPDFFKAIREIRPKYAFVENVPGLFSTNRGMFAREVFGDLAEIGYDAEWESIPASAIGSPQTRERCYIVAYPNDDRPSKDVFQQRKVESFGPALCEISREAQRSWSQREPPIPGVAYGIPDRVDRLKCLGNTVVPEVAEFIAKLIIEREKAIA
jgi:DNA (cytosine-5)-methyltransferase 1